MEMRWLTVYNLVYAILLMAALYVAFRIISMAIFKSWFDLKIWFEHKKKKGEKDEGEGETKR